MLAVQFTDLPSNHRSGCCFISQRTTFASLVISLLPLRVTNLHVGGGTRYTARRQHMLPVQKQGSGVHNEGRM